MRRLSFTTALVGVPVLAGANCHRMYYGHDIGLHSFDCILDVARGKPRVWGLSQPGRQVDVTGRRPSVAATGLAGRRGVQAE